MKLQFTEIYFYLKIKLYFKVADLFLKCSVKYFSQRSKACVYNCSSCLKSDRGCWKSGKSCHGQSNFRKFMKEYIYRSELKFKFIKINFFIWKFNDTMSGLLFSLRQSQETFIQKRLPLDLNAVIWVRARCYRFAVKIFLGM